MTARHLHLVRFDANSPTDEPPESPAVDILRALHLLGVLESRLLLPRDVDALDALNEAQSLLQDAYAKLLMTPPEQK